MWLTTKQKVRRLSPEGHLWYGIYRYRFRDQPRDLLREPAKGTFDWARSGSWQRQDQTLYEKRKFHLGPSTWPLKWVMEPMETTKSPQFEGNRGIFPSHGLGNRSFLTVFRGSLGRMISLCWQGEISFVKPVKNSGKTWKEFMRLK